ncbi:winged helix-turn-helix domain-containing protein [Kangiella sp.]|uniref:winged helix-turn-helix domain-containing protein n=1 Tax=Kangiella sp. TaxID=1920245 RepID=UPI0019B9DC7A|nr:winged helix-turn-helix domain-containing protein [Kangiella sp.]MBD3654669.1 winged helix-turn-helix domain-containing protein [Kangiella sp.]
MPHTSRCFNLVDWQVDPALNRLMIDEQTFELEPRVMQVLVCLYDHAEELVSKDDLLGEVWHGVSITDDAIYCSISKLRKTFRQVEEHRSPQLKTITRQGYMLCLNPVYRVLHDKVKAKGHINGGHQSEPTYGRRHDDRQLTTEISANGYAFNTAHKSEMTKDAKRLATASELKPVNLQIFVAKKNDGYHQEAVSQHKKLKLVLFILLSILLLQTIFIVYL